MLKLRKVEIVGFKSFCERTVVTFSGTGTTCIVGPNGCGKSNVVDAISWVLGEQSHKSLRAERMADCIFNGTTKRPPMGLAEVTITMEDPELAEAARFVMEGSSSVETSEPLDGADSAPVQPQDDSSTDQAAASDSTDESVARVHPDDVPGPAESSCPVPQRVGIGAQVIREGGARMGTLVTLHDVESRERIGNQLQVSERLAALGRVTAGVAHEVKNPLNSMRLWLEVLQSNMPVDPESQKAVKTLDSEITRLDRAVKTFLNFTQPVHLKLDEADLPGLLDEVLGAARPAITRAGLELRADLPAEFPPVLLDRQLIHQAVLNLLLNACDFTDPGGRITLRLRRAGECAVIAVADTGRGIPPDNQKKIFQLFFTTRKGGTGIGLANTFRFVQLHNGRIEFESEVGRGTTFRIELPLARLVEAPGKKSRDLGQPIAGEKR